MEEEKAVYRIGWRQPAKLCSSNVMFSDGPLTQTGLEVPALFNSQKGAVISMSTNCRRAAQIRMLIDTFCVPCQN